MSQENVEIVRRAIVAYSRTGEPAEDLFDPEVEVWESPELPGELAGKGYANLVRVNENLLDSFEEWSVESERFIDLGERILVFVRFRAKGKGSGVQVDAPLTYLFTLRDGRVIDWGLFGDRKKALEAVELSEQDAQGDS
jgi:ketosteroid isomerase-like protein